MIVIQYVDREGKTPLIFACLNPTLYDVAKILIELGANVNAYRPGTIGFRIAACICYGLCEAHACLD